MRFKRLSFHVEADIAGCVNFFRKKSKTRWTVAAQVHHTAPTRSPDFQRF
jgi:hypothetical protein